MITPYRAQKLLITKKLGNLKENWMVRTIDASQGINSTLCILVYVYVICISYTTVLRCICILDARGVTSASKIHIHRSAVV